MKVTRCLPLFIVLSTSASANTTEVIEVLAPKTISRIATGTPAASYLEEDFRLDLNRTIADRLNLLPGVSLAGQGGQFQSFSVRGFSGGRIRTEIDGIPVYTDRRAGNAASFISPELFNLIQVYKGPGAVLYGSQALGGIVSLSTELPEGTSLSLSAQSSGNGISSTIKHQQDNATMALAYQKGHNERTANDQELNTRFERASGLLRYQWQHSDLTTTVSWLPAYGQDIGKSNVKFPQREVSVYPDEIHSLAQVQVNADSGWLAKLFHHYQNWDSTTVRFDQYESENQYQSSTIGGQWLKSLEFVDVDSHVGVDWVARKGVRIDSEYRLFEGDTLTDSQIISNTLTGSEDNLGLYSRHTWQWGETTFDVGLRYDWIKQRSAAHQDSIDSSINSSLSISVPLSTSLTMSLDIANGFRYPTLSERFFNGRTPRGLITGEPSLRPEQSTGTQMELTWQPSDIVSLYAAFYRYALDDFIERYATGSDTFSYRNLPEADIHGLEAELRWYASDKVTHMFSYQKQSGKNHQHQTLSGLLPEQFNWTMLFAYEDITFSSIVSVNSGTDDVGPSEVSRASYMLWNTSVFYQLNNRQSLSLSVTNVTDQHYFANFDEDAPLQPERNVRLSTTWNF